MYIHIHCTMYMYVHTYTLHSGIRANYCNTYIITCSRRIVTCTRPKYYYNTVCRQYISSHWLLTSIICVWSRGTCGVKYYCARTIGRRKIEDRRRMRLLLLIYLVCACYVNLTTNRSPITRRIHVKRVREK